MSTLRSELIEQIKALPEEWLDLVNQAIAGLLKTATYVGNVNACPDCNGRIVKNGKQCGRQRHRCKCCGKNIHLHREHSPVPVKDR